MERGLTADRVLASLLRHKKLVGGIMAGVFLLGFIAVLSLPKVYKATAVVHMEQQNPSPELVQKTVSDTPEERFLTVRQELMGRPVLEQVIKQQNLYSKIVATKGMDAAIDTMRNDLDIKVAGETGFELTYSSRDPKVAANVANAIPVIYGKVLSQMRGEQAARATKLFTTEVDTLKGALTEWEKKIAQFKVDHNGELPEQMEVNMRGLERTATLMNANSEDLRAAEGRRSDIARSHYGADTEPGRLQVAEDTLRQQLVTARQQYTADHPDVKHMEAQLKTLHDQRLAAENSMVSDKQERVRSVATVGAIAGQMGNLQKQAEAYQKRLDATPRWAQELGVLERDYEITKTKYQSVVSRKVEAEIAQEMEDQSASRMLNVISPALVPPTAAKPDKMMDMLVVLVMALGAGLLTGVFFEMRDNTIRSGAELKDRLPLPVLAVVPQLAPRFTSEKRVLMPAISTTGVKAPTPSDSSLN